MLCFKKIPLAKTFMEKTGGGKVSRFSAANFLSQSAEKIRRGTLPCFRKILVSENVRDERGGGYHDFPSKLFCRTVSNHFVEEPFCVSQNFWYRKFLWIRGGKERLSRFPIKTFLSHSAGKISKGALFWVTITIFRYQKTFCLRGLCHDFLFIFLSYSAENLCRGTI